MRILELEFALSPDLDIPDLSRTFADRGRVTIDSILAQSTAVALHTMLRGRDDWKQVVNSGDKVVELDRETRGGLSDAQRTALDEAVYAGGRNGFQYRYETLRVPDEERLREASDDPLWRFANWWSSGPPIGLFRAITRSPNIGFADLQATAYSPGDFLTSHDDAVVGKNRLAAYVLGLTPTWRIEWGGLLLFDGEMGEPSAAFIPRFNQLNLFRVPRLHSVTEVTRSSPYRRYSLTGWLRR